MNTELLEALNLLEKEKDIGRPVITSFTRRKRLWRK